MSCGWDLFLFQLVFTAPGMQGCDGILTAPVLEAVLGNGSIVLPFLKESMDYC